MEGIQISQPSEPLETPIMPNSSPSRKWKIKPMILIAVSVIILIVILFVGYIVIKTQENIASNRAVQYRAKGVQIEADIQELRSALELYRFDNKIYPQNLDLLIPQYLKSIPKNPISLKSYGYETNGTAYTITTELQNGEVYTKSSPQ